MGKYNIHAGHCPQGKGAHGAVGYLQESVENRLVKNRVITVLKEKKHTVYDCTDDSNCTARQNLYNIVEKCNTHNVDMDVSVHLNAGRGTGVEVWVTGYWQDAIDLGNKICSAVSESLGIPNRGVKISKNLYVLNHTNSHSLLVECCFVDNETDADKWNAVECGNAIASAIIGSKIETSAKPIVKKPSPESGKIVLEVDSSWGTQTTLRTQQYYGTQQDGVISRQPEGNKGLLDNAWAGCWDFKSIDDCKNGSAAIRALQTDLKNKGYYAGAIDGWCGYKTIYALQSFLKDQGYYKNKLDGNMGPGTVAAWQTWLNKH